MRRAWRAAGRRRLRALILALLPALLSGCSITPSLELDTLATRTVPVRLPSSYINILAASLRGVEPFLSMTVASAARTPARRNCTISSKISSRMPCDYASARRQKQKQQRMAWIEPTV